MWKALLGRQVEADDVASRDCDRGGNDGRGGRRKLGDVDQGFGVDRVEEIALFFVVARGGEFDRRLDRPLADRAGGEQDAVMQRLQRRGLVGARIDRDRRGAAADVDRLLADDLFQPFRVT